MIFGGYGRKAKHRGDVFYPCPACEDLYAVYGLVEQYGYGQLYGVRVAKWGTHRFMVCSKCGSRRELLRHQWDAAIHVARSMSQACLTERTIHSAILALAELAFPAEHASVREILQLHTKAVESAQRRQLLVAASDAGPPDEATESHKRCPDCAEDVRTAARKCRYCGYEFETAA